MQWSLYPKKSVWRDTQAAVRERANKKCESCGVKHGTVKRSGRTGEKYVIYLHTAHRHGADPSSCDLADLLALCAKCHMAYDRQPEDEPVSRYRTGYTVTSTDRLIAECEAAGLSMWVDDADVYHWQIGAQGGTASSPVGAAAAALARYRSLEEEWFS